MDNKINLGGLHLNITAIGADEALTKINLLIEKLKEANSLINDLASIKVNIAFGDEDIKLIND